MTKKFHVPSGLDTLNLKFLKSRVFIGTLCSKLTSIAKWVTLKHLLRTLLKIILAAADWTIEIFLKIFKSGFQKKICKS